MSNVSPWAYLESPECLCLDAKSFEYKISTIPPSLKCIKYSSDPIYISKDEYDLSVHIESEINEKGLYAFCKNDITKKWFFLGKADRFDAFIWDNILRKDIQTIQVLTLFTNHIQANYYLLWSKNNTFDYHCSYFEMNSRHFENRDINFFEKALDVDCTKSLKCFFDEDRATLVQYMQDIAKGNNKDTSKEAKNWLKKIKYASVTNEIVNEGYELILRMNGSKNRKRKLTYNCAIFFNQYNRRKMKHTGCMSEHTEVVFDRTFIPMHHKCRKYFNNIAIVTDEMPDLEVKRLQSHVNLNKNKYKYILNSSFQDAAIAFYNLLATQKKWIAGVGKPTMSNLDQLASAMSNNRKGVIIVTGAPGTGKDAFMRAIHFAETDCSKAIERSLITTTALNLKEAYDSTGKSNKAFCEICTRSKDKDKEKVKNKKTFIIDEFNKAGSDLRSNLLRPLESPDKDLNCSTKCLSKDILFILGASAHLDELAKEAPQDFWTRITGQIRVIHPLQQVPEEDAEDFLKAFFWSYWWALSKKWLDIDKQNKEEKVKNSGLVRQILGNLSRGYINDRDVNIPKIVCDTFVQTIAPIATRDQVSIRGLCSMLQQIFTRVVWSTRYGMVPSRHAEADSKTHIRRAVNHAIQEVMVILNASRNAERTPHDENGTRSLVQAVNRVALMLGRNGNNTAN